VLLWKHFRNDKPRELAKLTVEFYKDFSLSAAKLMPDVPVLFDEGSLTSWRQLAQLRSFGDIASVPRAADYIRTVKLTRERLAPEDFFFVTVFSPLTMVAVWCGGDDVLLEMAEAPRAQVHEVLWALAGVASALSEAAVRAGADGIYYGCRGQGHLSSSQYGELGVPYDLAGLRGADAAELRALHVHGPLGEGLQRYAAYPVEVVGWSEVESGVTLAEGAQVLPDKVVMGGVPEDRSGPASELAQQTREGLALARAALGDRFIAAPGCSLPDATGEEVLRALRAAAEF
jgi:uroporphyrinogen-III decarboxylase